MAALDGHANMPILHQLLLKKMPRIMCLSLGSWAWSTTRGLPVQVIPERAAAESERK